LILPLKNDPSAIIGRKKFDKDMHVFLLVVIARRSAAVGWPPFGHESIEHEPLTALEQWKASRHRSLWLMVSNWSVSKRTPPAAI